MPPRTGRRRTAAPRRGGGGHGHPAHASVTGTATRPPCPCRPCCCAARPGPGRGCSRCRRSSRRAPRSSRGHSRRLGRVLHDQRPVQAPVQLDADVRVVPVGAGLGDGEGVGELPAGRDRHLGHAGHAVHVVADGHAVPVHGRLNRKPVHQQRLQDLALAHPDLRTRDLAAEAPRRNDRPAEVDVPGLRGHAGLHGTGAMPGGLGRGDLRAAGPDQVPPGGRGGRRKRRARAGRAPGRGAHRPQRGGGQPGPQHGPAVRNAHRRDHLTEDGSRAPGRQP